MMSSRFSLSAGSLFLLSLTAPAVAENYHLVETWQGKNFLDYFNFHTGSDPTNGFVNYLDQSSAESAGLIKFTDSGSLYLGVDHTTTLSASGKGRDSVRIGSKKYYDQSLVIADIAHMPGSICGTWPAFWSVGKQWPGDGEIDIIEGVNLQDHNEIVMHTAGTCSLTDTGMTGAVNATGCGEDLGTVGCVIEGNQGSYGTSFNRQGGGVYAMEWTRQFLKIWFFPRHSIPASITKGDPDVSQFGTPMALVEEGCDVAKSFKEQSFIFDVTFCGDWAGGVFGESGCPMSSSDPLQSCVNYVAQNPAQFEESYWEINSVKIYQVGAKDVIAPSASSSTGPHVSESPAMKTHATEAIEAAETQTSIASTSVEGSATTGTVAQLTADQPSVQTSASLASVVSAEKTQATNVPTSSSARYVTKYVTDTTTVCAQSEASPASLAHIQPPAGWHIIQQSQGTSESQSNPVAETASSVTQAPNRGASAEEVSGNQPDTALPTIIPAPGVVLGSAGLRLPSMQSSQLSQHVYSAATGSAAPSETAVPTRSSIADSPVFTGAADKVSVGLSLVAAVVGFAMVP